MPQDLVPSAGRQVDPQLLQQLLGRDIRTRGIPYSPGGPQFLQQQLMGADPSGALSSIRTPELQDIRNQSAADPNPQTFNVLSRLIQGRQTSSDDAARSFGPTEVSEGVTTAGKKTRNPFEILSQALFGVNRDREDQLARQARGFQ